MNTAPPPRIDRITRWLLIAIGIYSGLLVTLLVRVQRQGQRLMAVGLSDHYRQILALTRLDEAIGIANGTEFALTGGVYSRSPSAIARVKESFDVGIAQIRAHGIAARRHVFVIVREALDTLRPLVVALQR